jgi:hypothetical protein
MWDGGVIMPMNLHEVVFDYRFKESLAGNASDLRAVALQDLVILAADDVITKRLQQRDVTIETAVLESNPGCAERLARMGATRSDNGMHLGPINITTAQAGEALQSMKELLEAAITEVSAAGDSPSAANPVLVLKVKFSLVLGISHAARFCAGLEYEEREPLIFDDAYRRQREQHGHAKAHDELRDTLHHEAANRAAYPATRAGGRLSWFNETRTLASDCRRFGRPLCLRWGVCGHGCGRGSPHQVEHR